MYILRDDKVKVKGNIMKFRLKTLAKSEKIKTTKRMIEVKYE